MHIIAFGNNEFEQNSISIIFILNFTTAITVPRTSVAAKPTVFAYGPTSRQTISGI